jgi:CRP/FNR family transcriptional regulator, cyclic AMP receptor protein
MDVDRLRRLPLFGELDHHDLSTIARWAREVHVAEGDPLIEQDELPYELFVIEEGTAEVVHDGAPVATLGPGDVVGEMGLLQLRRRWATVRATSPVRAIALDTDDLAQLADQMPEVAAHMREIMSRRERDNEN